MTTEEVLKEYICSRYKSVRQFCQEFDLKYSTVVAMLNRGLRNSNIDTVFPVCKALDISVEPLVKDAAIVELGNEKRKTLGRRIEAYTLFARMMLETKNHCYNKSFLYNKNAPGSMDPEALLRNAN